MYVCVYIYVCTVSSRRACTRTPVKFTGVRAHTHTHEHTQTSTLTQTHTNTNTNMNTRTHTLTYTHTHTHAHTYTHTHTHTNKAICVYPYMYACVYMYIHMYLYLNMYVYSDLPITSARCLAWRFLSRSAGAHFNVCYPLPPPKNLHVYRNIRMHMYTYTCMQIDVIYTHALTHMHSHMQT